MKPAYYAGQWDELRRNPDPEQLQSLAHRIAGNFIERYFYNDEYNEGYINLLCEMATQNQQPELNQIAAATLFSVVVERLCDDFEDLQTETYNRLICQVTGYLRGLPEGRDLDEKLEQFGLQSNLELFHRIESIRLSPDRPLPHSFAPQKILVLSRITIGADVAVTSIICQRMAQRYPAAELVVFGNQKLYQVMDSDSGIRVNVLSYERRGGLLERFRTWLGLLQEVNAEIAGLAHNAYLLLDPDSRLTQLGVLPLVQEANYRFFNSRGKAQYPEKGSISELTNLWLNNILAETEFAYPKVWPSAANCRISESFVRRHRNNRQTITINLGVGGNQRKRVPGEFETRLILTLLNIPGTRIMLDRGFGHEELERSQLILDAATAAGFKVIQKSYADLEGCQDDFDLLGIECSVGEIATLIAVSQEFIGYDSACQHIAAALGIKTFTVFAGTNNVRFIRRWHACGPNASEILFVDTLSRDAVIDETELVQRLMDMRAQ